MVDTVVSTRYSIVISLVRMWCRWLDAAAGARYLQLWACARPCTRRGTCRRAVRGGSSKIELRGFEPTDPSARGPDEARGRLRRGTDVAPVRGWSLPLRPSRIIPYISPIVTGLINNNYYSHCYRAVIDQFHIFLPLLRRAGQRQRDFGADDDTDYDTDYDTGLFDETWGGSGAFSFEILTDDTKPLVRLKPRSHGRSGRINLQFFFF
jgi:hypothetical protein